MTCNHVFFSYDKLLKGKDSLLKDVTCNVDMSSRVAIMGANGAGKSTLINLLLGNIEADSGTLTRNGSARIATFSQHHMEVLQAHLNSIEFMCEIFPGGNQQEMRAHLGSFGMSGDLALQRIGSLSGGQKSRVAFAMITFKYHLFAFALKLRLIQRMFLLR